MALGSGDNITVEVVPDADSFSLKLTKALKRVNGEVNVVPKLSPSGLTEFRKDLKTKLNGGTETKINIKPTFLAGDITELRKGLKTKIDAGSDVKIQVKPSFATGDVTALRKEINASVGKAKGIASDIKVKINIIPQISTGSLSDIRRQVNLKVGNQVKGSVISSSPEVRLDPKLTGFKRLKEFERITRGKINGSLPDVVSPKITIDIIPNVSTKSLAAIRKEVKQAVNTVNRKGEAVDAPIKLNIALERISKVSIAKTKAQILSDFGVVKLPVVSVAGKNVVGALGGSSGGASLSGASSIPKALKNPKIPTVITKNSVIDSDVPSYRARTLAKDLTVLGRAATAGKSGLFSFLGATTIAQVGITAVTTGIVQGTKAFIKFGLESSKNVENVKRSFNGFLGDVDKTNKLFTQLQDFAAVTPFDLDSLAKSSRVLLGAGIESKNLLGVLKDIAGVGAQLGVSGAAVERVTNAIAKIKGQGKVTQRELRTIFTAFPGFVPIRAIADNIKRFGGIVDETGKVIQQGSTQKALKAITAGTVGADEGINALLASMRNFPGAASALIAQSLTLAGSQETLRDRFQQVARAATDPSVGLLARNYRTAAEIFNKQSKTGDVGGISDLINQFGNFAPVIAKLVVPAINSFAGAFATILPPIREFISNFGPALLDGFGAVLNLLPALASGLTLVLNIITPFTPIINSVASALSKIPASFITVIAAIKLLGSVSGGSGGGIFSKIFGSGASSKPGFFSNQLGDISKGFDKIKSTLPAVKNGLSDSFKINGVRGYSNELKKLYTQQRNYQSLVGTSAGKQSGFFGKNAQAEVTAIGKQIDKVQTKFTESGANISQKISGSFSAIGSAVKGAGNQVSTFATTALSSLKSFGIELAISAGIAAITYYFDKAQKAKKLAQDINRDSTTIADKLKFDTTATSGQLEQITVLNEAIKQTTGSDAYKKLLEGKGQTQFSRKTTNKFLKKFQQDNGDFITKTAVVNQSTNDPGGSAQVKFSKTLDANLARLDNARKIVKGDQSLIRKVLIGSDKEFNKTISDLNLAGQVVRDTRDNSFGAVNPENFAGKLKVVRKLYKEGYSKILSDNAAAAKKNKNTGLASFFTEQKAEFDKTGDVAKSYDVAAQKINENAVASNNLSKELRGVVNGSTKGAKAIEILGRAGSDASVELTALQKIADSLSTINDLSFSTVEASFKPGQAGQIFQEVQARNVADPSGNSAAKFVDQLAANLGLDEKESQAFADYLADFKTKAIADIKTSAGEIAAAIPALSDAFKVDFKFEIGGIDAKTLKANLKAYTDGIKSFGDNINKLKAQFPDLAEKIAALGPAAGGQLAKDLASNPSLAQQIRESLATATSVYDQYSTGITGIVQSNYEKINGFNPGELNTPDFTITKPDQSAIDAVAQQLADIEAQIQAKKQAFIDSRKTLKVPQRGRFGVEDVNAKNVDGYSSGSTLDRAIPQRGRFGVEDFGGDKKVGSIKRDILELEGSAQKLRDKQKELSATVFSGLKTAASDTTTVISSTFAKTDIATAIAPSVNGAVATINEIPASINKVAAETPQQISTAVSSPFNIAALNETGGTLAGAMLDGFRDRIFDSLPLLNLVLSGAFISFGQSLVAAMASGLSGMKDTIVQPFKDARIPLNTFLSALNNISVAVGSTATFTPIPSFHTGGIVGEKSRSHRGRLKSDEQVAVLQKKEGILPTPIMRSIGKESFEHLRKGNYGEFASRIGGGEDNVTKFQKFDAEKSSGYVSSTERDLMKSAYNAYKIRVRKNSVPENIAEKVVDKIYNSSLSLVDKLDAKIAKSLGGLPNYGALSGNLQSIYKQLEAVKGRNGSYKQIMQAMKSSGINVRPTSTVRPGAITASDNRSLHSAGRAVDFAGSKKDMLAAGKWWTNLGPILAELIHTPLGYGIKNGKRIGSFGARVDKGHYDHLHVALREGGIVKGSPSGLLARIGEDNRSEAVLPLKDPSRMGAIITSAMRSGEMSNAGARAVNNATTNSTDNSRNVEKVEVTVVAPVSDASLQGKIIGHRVVNALKGL